MVLSYGCSQLPLKSLISLKRTRGVVSIGFDWPRGEAAYKKSPNFKRPSPFYDVIDIPYIWTSNIDVYVDEDTLIPDRVRYGIP